MAGMGYWKNWERNIAWMMREIIYSMLKGNPNIKEDTKPKSVQEVYRISDDDKVQQKKKQDLTPEDIEYFKNVFKKDL